MRTGWASNKCKTTIRFWKTYKVLYSTLYTPSLYPQLVTRLERLNVSKSVRGVRFEGETGDWWIDRGERAEENYEEEIRGNTESRQKIIPFGRDWNSVAGPRDACNPSNISRKVLKAGLIKRRAANPFCRASMNLTNFERSPKNAPSETHEGQGFRKLG